MCSKSNEPSNVNLEPVQDVNKDVNFTSANVKNNDILNVKYLLSLYKNKY